MVFEYLPKSYKGADTEEGKLAREKMHNASCIAGMAFANAFLGVNHSLAHKLGARFHIPHGIANAYCFSQVIKFNASEKPTKQSEMNLLYADFLRALNQLYSAVKKHPKLILLDVFVLLYYVLHCGISFTRFFG